MFQYSNTVCMQMTFVRNLCVCVHVRVYLYVIVLCGHLLNCFGSYRLVCGTDNWVALIVVLTVGYFIQISCMPVFSTSELVSLNQPQWFNYICVCLNASDYRR